MNHFRLLRRGALLALTAVFSGAAAAADPNDRLSFPDQQVAGGHNIVRFFNAGGIKLHHVRLDGLCDVSGAAKRCKSTVRVGDAVPAWGGIAPLGDTSNIEISNVVSYSRSAIFIGGSLADSTFRNVKNCNPDAATVVYQSGMEYIRGLRFENVT